jgi:hypothetical protein
MIDLLILVVVIANLAVTVWPVKSKEAIKKLFNKGE